MRKITLIVLTFMLFSCSTEQDCKIVLKEEKRNPVKPTFRDKVRYQDEHITVMKNGLMYNTGDYDSE